MWVQRSSKPDYNIGLLDDISDQLVGRLHSLLVKADDGRIEAVFERRIPFEMLLNIVNFD
jgi:hypothetical protein